MRPYRDLLKDIIAVSRGQVGHRELPGRPRRASAPLIVNGGEYKVECEMNDRNEGKDNCIQVRYPIEASYIQDLEQAIGAFVESLSKVQA